MVLPWLIYIYICLSSCFLCLHLSCSGESISVQLGHVDRPHTPLSSGTASSEFHPSTCEAVDFAFAPERYQITSRGSFEFLFQPRRSKYHGNKWSVPTIIRSRGAAMRARSVTESCNQFFLEHFDIQGLMRIVNLFVWQLTRCWYFCL